MNKKIKLTKDITEKQFDEGYWYAEEIKSFAKEIGIPNSSILRKDELEKLIKIYFRKGKIETINKNRISKVGIRDFESGLKLSLPITNYTNNRETMTFIEQEALKKSPVLKKKSGVKYRLNRWREEQFTKDKKITYDDLVNEYIRLSETKEPFERIPQARYINFLSDYLANEKNATREEGIKIWKQLKKLQIPKDYKAWKRFENKSKTNI